MIKAYNSAGGGVLGGLNVTWRAATVLGGGYVLANEAILFSYTTYDGFYESHYQKSKASACPRR